MIDNTLGNIYIPVLTRGWCRWYCKWGGRWAWINSPIWLTPFIWISWFCFFNIRRWYIWPRLLVISSRSGTLTSYTGWSGIVWRYWITFWILRTWSNSRSRSCLMTPCSRIIVSGRCGLLRIDSGWVLSCSIWLCSRWRICTTITCCWCMIICCRRSKPHFPSYWSVPANYSSCYMNSSPISRWKSGRLSSYAAACLEHKEIQLILQNMYSNDCNYTIDIFLITSIAWIGRRLVKKALSSMVSV